MMHKKCFILALLIFWIICGVVSAENVMFKSNNKSKDDKPLMLTGILAKPAGDGPFPAAVLLHGASGVTRWYAQKRDLVQPISEMGIRDITS